MSEVNVTEIRKNNTENFLREYRSNEFRTVVVDGHVRKDSPVSKGQIRQSGKGRFLVLREAKHGWLVCQIGDYGYPAAESEITIKGYTLLVWNSFPSNEQAILDTVQIGVVDDDILNAANSFYDLYMSVKKIPADLAVHTGYGTVWDTEEMVQYMEHMSAKLGDFIVKAIQ